MNRSTCLGGRVETGRRLPAFQSSPRTRQRRLHAHGCVQHGCRLLERQVQDIFHQNCGALLRVQRLEQRSRRWAAVRRVKRCDRCRLRPLQNHSRLFSGRPAHPVDPEIRRRANQVRLRILQPGVGLSQEAEYAHQGVLDEILPIPDVSSQLAAIAVQRGPVHRQLVDITPPGAPYRALHAEVISRSRHRVPRGTCHLEDERERSKDI